MVGSLLLFEKECNDKMNELKLKYGCNPNQKPARIFMKDGELPIKILNGKPVQL